MSAPFFAVLPVQSDTGNIAVFPVHYNTGNIAVFPVQSNTGNIAVFSIQSKTCNHDIFVIFLIPYETYLNGTKFGGFSKKSPYFWTTKM